VVLPAHNEELLLPGSLEHLRRSLTHAVAADPDLEVSVVVVLNGCTDRSEQVVAARPWATALVTPTANVGAARQRGLQWLSDTVSPDWFACTDADSTVPLNWLNHHVDYARTGGDLLLGTVVINPTDLGVAARGAWASHYQQREGHPHVHGANMGLSRRAWQTTGGFEPLANHEDVDLVARVKQSGLSWRATGRIPVTTSGRLVARADDGFARYLRVLLAGLTGSDSADSADSPDTAA
jgi:glycosyltransferase involved in cell wall biosynthesis